MADPYMLDPTQYAGMFEPDPELVRRANEQAKAMMAMRMGLGMLGKEPLGSAAAGGFRTYFATQEDARRNAHEQQQMALQKFQLAQKLRQEQQVSNYIDQLDKQPDVRRRHGISDAQWEYIKANRAVADVGKALEPKITKPGDVLMSGTEQVYGRGQNGINPVMVNGVEVAMPTPGYSEAIAAQEAAKTGAQERAKYPYQILTNVPGPTGPRSGLASDLFGTPQPGQPAPQSGTAPRGTLPPQLHGNFTPEEKMRILQDITGQKPFEQVAGQTNVMQGQNTLDVKQAEAQIQLEKDLTGKTADVYLNNIKTDMPGVRQAVSQAIPLNHMALAMLDSGKVITGKGANVATEVGGWLAQAGFNKAQDSVANTQAFVLLQAREALAILGSRALGAGTGISAKDLEFAKDIAAGNITLTEDALRRLVMLNEKAHRLKAQDYNKVVDEYAKQYNRPDALGLKVDLPPEYSKPQANAIEPPPIAIQTLRKNPGLAAEFKRKYGVDPALYLR